MFTIHFKDVGRTKASWSVKTEDADESTIAREARKKAVLMSSVIDAEKNDDGLSGVILVGGWRSVGTFTIE